jgi:nucleoside-diphosphate-sugar epimerase
VSVVGERYTHGHVFDFSQLQADPTTLHVLGNGKQRKSYIYVQDCIDAMLAALERAHDKVNVFNLGTDEYCQVNDSIGWITGRLGIAPKLATRRRARLDRRQPVHLPRHQEDPRARLAAQARHPRRHRQDRRWLTANRWVFERRS